jgi:hypothetical protein
LEEKKYMGNKRTLYELLSGKSEENVVLTRPRPTDGYDINMDMN